jgi:hypothetical protein
MASSNGVHRPGVSTRTNGGRVGRYYDPTTGQFLTVDPMVEETGQPYAYTGDDPVNETDPLGLWGWNPISDVTQAAHDVGHYVNTHKAAIAEVAAGVTIVVVVVAATVATGGIADFAFAAIGTAAEEGGTVGALEGFTAAAHAGFVFLLPATLALFGGAMIARAGPSLLTGSGMAKSSERCS